MTTSKGFIQGFLWQQSQLPPLGSAETQRQTEEGEALAWNEVGFGPDCELLPRGSWGRAN